MLIFRVVKSDSWIRRMAAGGMIEPFDASSAGQGKVSFGPSAYGYDMRVSEEFKIFTGTDGSVMDPKGFDPGMFSDFKGDVCIIPPNSFVLAMSLEYFRIPRDVLAICLGKSTYARMGVIVNVTPLEPEWEGHVTMSLSNTAPVPVRIYANEGIAQVVFIGADEVCETSYMDKAGKYQAQKEITPPKVD